MRKDKINYYLDIAEAVANRGTCLRRKFGSIIVNNDEIISTGYVGAPRGRVNCCDLGKCKREELNIPQGERYELCRSVHAEANAMLSASRKSMLNSTLYLVCKDSKTSLLVPETSPCSMCRRLIINAGINTVIIRDTDTQFRTTNVSDWLEEDSTFEFKHGY